MRPALPLKRRLLRYLSFKPDKIGSRGWGCTRTGGALNAVPLLLGYATMEGELAPAVGLSPTRTRLKGEVLGYFAFTGIWKLAERRDLHPIPQMRGDLLSTESRHAGPVHVPK